MRIPSGFGNLVFRYTYSGVDADEMSSSCGFVFSGSVDVPAGVEIILSELSAELGPFISNAVDFTGSTTYINTGDIEVLEAGPANGGVFGTSTAAKLSTQAAYTVRKNTPLFGRKGRGRMLLPGVLTPQLDANGHINATALANMNAALADWMADWESVDGGMLPMLLHTDVSPAPTEITSFTMAPLLATTRHRYRN